MISAAEILSDIDRLAEAKQQIHPFKGEVGFLPFSWISGIPGLSILLPSFVFHPGWASALDP